MTAVFLQQIVFDILSASDKFSACKSNELLKK